jgi:putative sigma-54 modulation protein
MVRDFITLTGTRSDALEQHAIDRLTAALDQHEAHLIDVLVRLHDLNGPKGGSDQRCQIIVQAHGMPNVVIDERGDDLYAIISTAADRIKQTVGRQLQKKTSRRQNARA